VIISSTDPHPFQADLYLGFQIFANPGLDFFPQIYLEFYVNKVEKKTFGSGSKCGSGSRDFKNADPVRIRIRNPASTFG